jgi:hypothetical protein
MADRTIIVLVPATNFDFLTVDECKLLLGLDLTDTADDAELKAMISINSATIAKMCKRTFAQEKVRESWRKIGKNRLYLSHWPIKQDSDIESVTAAGGLLDPSAYELEPDSGKLSIYSPDASGAGTAYWDEPATVVYTGGYILPDEAPLPLKHATAILVREDRLRNMQAQVGGIKSISHEGRSVSYFDPSLLLRATQGRAPGLQAAENLAKHYMRIEA